MTHYNPFLHCAPETIAFPVEERPTLHDFARLALDAHRVVQFAFPDCCMPAVFVADPSDLGNLPGAIVHAAAWDGVGVVRLNCEISAGLPARIGDLRGEWIEPKFEHSKYCLQLYNPEHAGLLTSAAVTEILRQWESPTIFVYCEGVNEIRSISCRDHEASWYSQLIDLTWPCKALCVECGYFTKEPVIYLYQSC